MKIAFVAARSWPAVGGMESFLRDLSGELTRRHDVLVLAQGLDSGPRGRLADSLFPPPPFEAFADGDARVEQLRLSPARRAALAPLVMHVVPGFRRYAYGRTRHAATELFARTAAPVIADAARGADVIHMWGGGLLGAAALRAARLLGVPAVMTPFAHEGRWGDDAASGATYRGADTVVALLHDEARTYTELGVDPARIEVVGVCSAGAAAGGGPELRRRLAIDGPLVLFVGVRRPYKGFDLLLAAAPRVEGDVTFAFVGPGAPVPPSRDARLLDVGEVDPAGKAAWIEAADLVCLPSESEIFPATFLEAWSLGTPVLASDIPTLHELVERSGGGFTAPREPGALADAITRALADPERLRAAGEAGRAFWREHTPSRVAARYEDVYVRLTGTGEPCAA